LRRPRSPFSIIGNDEQQITVSWGRYERGLAASTNQWLDYVYLSSERAGENQPRRPANLNVVWPSLLFPPTPIIYLPNFRERVGSSVPSDGGNVVTN